MNTNPYFSSLYFASIFSLWLQKTDQEHVLPVFQDLWYDVSEGNDFIGTDSCGIAYFNYTLESFESFQQAAPEHSDCIWDFGHPVSHYTYTSMPPGFISTNLNDWSKIIEDPSAPLTEYYHYSCKSDEGASIDYYTIYVSPFYDCPPNTRLSHDNFTYEIGCTTTPLPCLADAVARDLTFDSIKKCGHIGMISSFMEKQPTVLEVLNDPEGIFINPLYGNDSFTTKTAYWGEKYGLGNVSRVPVETANAIIETGLRQMSYAFSYIYIWLYYPGGTQKHPNNCMFRCDSFVYYCYKEGHFPIQDAFGPLDSPKTLYNDFICSADPIGTCPTHSENLIASDTLCIFEEKSTVTPHIPNQMITMFTWIRSILAEKNNQQKGFNDLIHYIESSKNENAYSLFVRCLCAELNYISPDVLDEKIKPLLSSILYEYQFLSQESFLFIAMTQGSSFYRENPVCHWLNAYVTVSAKNSTEQTEEMMNYIDRQDHLIDQAYLIISSNLFLNEKRRNKYGYLFKEAYHQNQTLTEKERKVFWLALALMKIPLSAEKTEYSFFNNKKQSNNADKHTRFSRK